MAVVTDICFRKIEFTVSIAVSAGFDIRETIQFMAVIASNKRALDIISITLCMG